MANAIRERPTGAKLGCHLATPASWDVVINGIAIYHTPLPQYGQCSGVPQSYQMLKGRGGASFVNHCFKPEKPNCKFVRDMEGDGQGLFVVSLENVIPRNTFLRTSYGEKFIDSSRTNIE